MAKFGLGAIRQAIPLSGSSCIVVSGSGAVLFDLASGMVLWEIDCPSVGAALAGDCSLLALNTGDSVALWSLQDGKCLQQLETGFGFALAISLSPDGKLLAASGEGPNVRIWETDSGVSIRDLEHPGEWVRSFVFDREGSRIAVAGGKGNVNLWDLRTGKRSWHRDAQGAEAALAFSPDGSLLAMGTGDGKVRFLLAPSGDELVCLDGMVSQLEFSPDGRRLVSSGRTQHVWNVATGEVLRRFETTGHGFARFISEDDVLVWEHDSTSLAVWSLSDGALKGALDRHIGRVSDIAVSHDGKSLATAGESVWLWDLLGGKQAECVGATRAVGVAFDKHGSLWMLTPDAIHVRTVESSGSERVLGGWSHGFSCASLAPDAPACALWGYQGDGRAHVWRFRGSAECHHVGDRQGPHRVIRAVFGPGGEHLATLGTDDTVRLWDPGSGEELGRLSGVGNRACLGFSSEPGFLAVAASSATPDPRSIRIAILRVEDLSASPQWDGSMECSQCRADGLPLAFSENLAYLLVMQDFGAIKVCDTHDGRSLGELHGHPWNSVAVAFGRSDSLLATAGFVDGSIRLWVIGNTPTMVGS